MKLATGAGYWAAGPPSDAQETILEAEALGFHSFWTAEAYGSDALTPLAKLRNPRTRCCGGDSVCTNSTTDSKMLNKLELK